MGGWEESDICIVNKDEDMDFFQNECDNFFFVSRPLADSQNKTPFAQIIRQINTDINIQLSGVAPKDRIKQEHKSVIFKIFDKHRETIKLLGFTHLEFLYQMSLINGVIKERD